MIGVHGTPVTITPKDTPTHPFAIDDMTKDELPTTIHLSELRPVLTFKGKIWGIAEHTDLHPTETHLPAIPGVCPAMPLAKVAARDIARRLSHRTAATPRAQKTWPEKLGYGTNGLLMDWDKLYAHTFNKILIPRDRDVFVKLLHRATGPLHTGGFGANRRPCPTCHNANYNLIHLARCTGNEPIFNMIERIIAAIEPGTSFSNPNPPAAHAVSAAHRLNLLAQRVLACQLADPNSLAAPEPSRATPLSRASIALYALTWDRIYKTTAAAAIAADTRRANRADNTPLSPPPAQPSLAAAQTATIKLILTTFQARIIGFTKSRIQQANIANSLGAKQDPRKTVNKELKGAAYIADNGTLLLDTSVAAAINGIATELNLPDLAAFQPTRVLPPKPAKPAAAADAHVSPGRAPALPRRAGIGYGAIEHPSDSSAIGIRLEHPNDSTANGIRLDSSSLELLGSDDDDDEQSIYFPTTPLDYSDDEEEEPPPRRPTTVSLLAGDLSEDSDDYEEDAPADATATPASNAASSSAAHASLPPSSPPRPAPSNAAAPCPMAIDPPSPELTPNPTAAQEDSNAALPAPCTPTASLSASSPPLLSPPSKRSREQMPPPPPPPLEPAPPLGSPLLALGSALDVGLCSESDEQQPAAAGKKKRRSLQRKSSGVRRYEAQYEAERRNH